MTEAITRLSVALKPAASPNAAMCTPHSYSAPQRAHARDHHLAVAQVDCGFAAEKIAAESQRALGQFGVDGQHAEQR
ncbi:hypothetical protein M0765_028775 [Variovorax sp. S2]|uniref:hypothetical protein n=1 Tax=Variovorax sp. S12S4 TaxID=3029170 RepID=UPI00215C6F00|nr:hypothetical protein [Variovorax sp. S12S4]MCR8961583.1 hypothetical protein [Variovorax sp. S12S4]